MNKIAIYTTAPKDYDYFYTTEISPNVGSNKKTGKIIRKVEMDPSRIEDQCARYGSGLHMNVRESEWKKLVQYELVNSAE